MQVAEESRGVVEDCDWERRDTRLRRRYEGADEEGLMVAVAPPCAVESVTEEKEEARKDSVSKSTEPGVQVMARVSVEEGGTGRVRMACTEE